MGGSGKGGGSSKSSPYEEAMAKIAEQVFGETTPLRQGLTQRLFDVSMGGIDPSTLPAYAPLYSAAKTGIEDQYNMAKENIIGGTPTGGALTGALTSLEGDRAQQLGAVPAGISSQLIQDLTNKAYGTAFAAPGQAMQGYQGAAGSYNNRMAINAQQNAASNQMMQTIGTGIGTLAAASMCCFIFIESHGGLDPVVRRYRDEHMTVRNRRGYCWLADRLVPLMRRNRFVRAAVKWMMVKPMTSYGRFHYGQGYIGAAFAPVAGFWLALFSALGHRPPYRRAGTLEVV